MPVTAAATRGAYCHPRTSQRPRVTVGCTRASSGTRVRIAKVGSSQTPSSRVIHHQPPSTPVRIAAVQADSARRVASARAAATSARVSEV